MIPPRRESAAWQDGTGGPAPAKAQQEKRRLLGAKKRQRAQATSQLLPQPALRNRLVQEEACP